MYLTMIHAVLGLLLAAPDTTASIVHSRPANGQQNAYQAKVRRLTCGIRNVQGLAALPELVMQLLPQCCSCIAERLQLMAAMSSQSQQSIVCPVKVYEPVQKPAADSCVLWLLLSGIGEECQARPGHGCQRSVHRCAEIHQQMQPLNPR